MARQRPRSTASAMSTTRARLSSATAAPEACTADRGLAAGLSLRDPRGVLSVTSMREAPRCGIRAARSNAVVSEYSSDWPWVDLRRDH
jgi:hypothetical protein